jgi:hypothetical protein
MNRALIVTLLSFSSLLGFSQTATSTNAQKIGFGIDLGLPFTTGYGSLIGGLVRFEHPLKSDLSITASLGYSRLGYEKEVREAFKALNLNTFTERCSA